VVIKNKQKVEVTRNTCTYFLLIIFHRHTQIQESVSQTHKLRIKSRALLRSSHSHLDDN